MDDLESIKQLKARFTRAVDSRDWDTCRRLLTDDFSVTSPGGGTVSGADAFVERFRSALSEGWTVHHAHMPDVELTSETTARGTWSMEGWNRWPDGRELHEFGVNRETYEKLDGDWRISSSKVD